jgi:rhodanese-related sulfurtransferase
MSKHKTQSKTQAKTSRPRLWIGLGIVVAIIVIVAVIILWPGGQAADTASLPAEITVKQAREKYDQGVFFLDVRTTEEWNTIHIPNTTLIPLDELSGRVDELPKDKEIVVVCRSGNRSKQGRDILKQAGFEQVTSMSGGVNAWSSEGYPTEAGTP